MTIPIAVIDAPARPLYRSIRDGALDQTNVDFLTVVCARAATVVLTDDLTPNVTREWVKNRATSMDKLQVVAKEALPLVLASKAMEAAAGDLTTLGIDDVVPTVIQLLASWVRSEL